MYQDTGNQIFQKKEIPIVRTAGINVSAYREAINKRKNVGRKRLKAPCTHSFPGIGKDINRQSRKKARINALRGTSDSNFNIRYIYKKRSGISCNMHIVQYQHLQ